ncbi:MAG: OmpH family outer membrane protein [Nitrospirae bacterium]|nr:OmpH family outer membrane protein [Nitrospirota bacterium]
MKKVVLVFASVLIAAMILSNPLNAADKVDAVKIGVVDLQKVIIQSTGGKEARGLFEGEMTAKKKALTEKEEMLKKLRSEIDKGGISDSAKKEKEDNFQKDARDLRRLRDETESTLREMDKAITVKMIGEIREVISKLGDEGKYTLILEKDASVLYMPNTIDLTGRVIENYDKQKAKK